MADGGVSQGGRVAWLTGCTGREGGRRDRAKVEEFRGWLGRPYPIRWDQVGKWERLGLLCNPEKGGLWQ